MSKGSRNLLTAVMIKQANKPGYLRDGGGLVLQVTKSGAKSWLYRYRAPGGRIREMGLGGLVTVSLADARRQAERLRLERSDGHDPLEKRRQLASQSRRDTAKRITFETCA